MPIYEYRCTNCGKTHEIMQKFSDAPLSSCPDCGSLLQKMISHTSFVLKGTGWYATDYASGKSTSNSDKSPDKSEGKTEVSKQEDKTKAESKPKKEEAAVK
ncbi:MAG TPA: zinc ribbon domain-containing protein [Dissulfurispiraceae bacterium]|nr:zinc ribbon domain-containing protein [Dissulfurispiraceae bacterium]